MDVNYFSTKLEECLYISLIKSIDFQNLENLEIGWIENKKTKVNCISLYQHIIGLKKGISKKDKLGINIITGMNQHIFCWNFVDKIIKHY